MNIETHFNQLPQLHDDLLKDKHYFAPFKKYVTLSHHKKYTKNSTNSPIFNSPIKAPSKSMHSFSKNDLIA